MNYTDDLIGAGIGDRAWQAVKYLGVILEGLGLVEKQIKEKLTEIKQLVKSWLKNTKATKRKLKRLIGKLLFVAKCVPSSRLFVGRLLDVL